jgi:curved DNA-binding protein
MRYKDYYKTLGVARTATEAEIKKAYRKLASKYHPDVSKEANAKEKFQEIGEAYETLGDTEKRGAYDSLGQHKAGQNFRPPPGWSTRFGAGGDDPGGIDLGDLFASFGRGRAGGNGFGGAPRARRGEDQEVNVQISLEEAAHGTEISMEVTGHEPQPDGRVITRTRPLRARIPPGVTQGERMRLAGRGGPGASGGPAGDLFLNISLRPHARFRAQGHDLYLDMPLRDWEAALGATVEIPTLDGPVALKVPAGSKSGQQLRLSGKGLPTRAGKPGNLYAVLAIAVASPLSDAARSHYEALRDLDSAPPREQPAD